MSEIADFAIAVLRIARTGIAHFSCERRLLIFHSSKFPDSPPQYGNANLLLSSLISDLTLSDDSLYLDSRLHYPLFSCVHCVLLILFVCGVCGVWWWWWWCV